MENNLNIRQKQHIQQLRQLYPDLKSFPDNEILSIINNVNFEQIKLPDDKKISAFFNANIQDNNDEFISSKMSVSNEVYNVNNCNKTETVSILQPQSQQNPDEGREKVTLDDILEINKMCEGDSQLEKNKYSIFKELKYKDQIPLLKYMINYRKNVTDIYNLTPYDIECLLKKINTVDEFNEIITAQTDVNSIVSEISYNYKTPYWNLYKKLSDKVKLNEQDFRNLKLLLDTPEKIAIAESCADNFVSISDIIQKVTGNDTNKIYEEAKNKIDNKYGDGVTDKYLKDSHFSDYVQSPLQMEAVLELMEFKDDPAFIVKETCRYDIGLLINDVIPFIKTEDDIVNMKKIVQLYLKTLSDKTSKNPMYCSSNFRYHLTKEDYFANNDIERKYISTVINSVEVDDAKAAHRQLKKIELLNRFDNDEKMEILKNYLSQDNFIIEFDYIVSSIDDEMKCKALKMISEYNANHHGKISLSAFGTNLDFIKNEIDVEFFEKCLQRYDLKDILNYLNACNSDIKKEAYLKLIEEESLKDRAILKVIKHINTDEDLIVLKDLLNNKEVDKTYKKREFINELRCAKNERFNELISDGNKIFLNSIQNEDDIEFLEMLKKYGVIMDQLYYLDKAQISDDHREAVEYIIKNGAYDLFDRFDSLKGMYNICDKVKAFNEVGIEKFTESDFKEFKKHKFFTDSYLCDMNKSEEASLPHYSEMLSEIELTENINIGDVIVVGEDLYIKENDSLEKLDLTENTYLKLFPFESRFSTRQTNLGDCQLVSTIDAMLQSPKYRSKLLKLFHEDNGSINIVLSDNVKTEFPNGRPLATDSECKHVEGCDGFRMIEEALAKYNVRKNIEYNDKYEISSDYYKKDMLNNIEQCLETLANIEEDFIFEALVGNIDSSKILKVPDHYEEVLLKYTNGINAIIKAGISSGVYIPQQIASEYGLVDDHAYRIEKYDKENKIVSVVNPHDTKYIIELPLDIFERYFNYVNIFEL